MIPGFMGSVLNRWKQNPVAVSVEPETVLPAGGAITVHGRGFRAGVSVKVGGVAATLVVVVTSRLLTCVAPVMGVGSYTVSVDDVAGPMLEYSVL